MNNIILQQFEINNPTITIDKNKSISKNEFVWREQYILIINNKEMYKVLYEGNHTITNNDDEFERIQEVTLCFRCLSEPYLTFKLSISDIDNTYNFYSFEEL